MGSTPFTPVPALPPTTGLDAENSRKAWLGALLLALLLHLFLSFSIPRGVRNHKPVSVSLKPMARSDLERLKERWKSLEAREQQILLEKNRNAKTSAAPPPDAKYLSDRNARVDQQMRAKESAVVPRPGAPGIPRTSPREAAPPPAAPAPKRVDLGKLGVPLAMTPQNAAKSRTDRARSRDQSDPRPRGQLGSSQTLLDERLPEGSQNMLNTRESVFYSFYARLYESIAPVWESRVREVPRQRRLAPGDYVTVVEVEINRPGALVDVRVLRSSGVPAFDQAVMDSWRKLARFPNPPQGLLNGQNSVSMKWSFQFRLAPGSALRVGAPERVL